MRTILRACAVVLLALPPLLAHSDEYSLVRRTDGHPDYQYYPSPEDWRDVNMYQIFTDRFFDGNQGNNFARYSTQGGPWYNEHNRNDEDARHLFQGGDWAGIRQKLDYLQGMGVNSIWISGVQLNEQGVDKRFTPYHAYHPSNFYQCEPMFGTFQELKDLVDDAHSRGMYVVIDVVINHTADLLQYQDCSCDHDYYCGSGCGNLVYRDNNVRFGWPFDDPGLFHNNGLIVNYDAYPENIQGSFLGTDDLKTEDPYVQGKLDEIFKHLIDATDCDGFRVDAIKHVEYTWVKEWANNMRQHAAWLGKSNFILFGELFSYDDGAQVAFCKDDGYSFNSTLWFPMQLTLRNVFAYEQNTSQLGDRLSAMGQYGEARNNLVAFMDNHDVDRIALECGSAWESKLRPALTFMYTALPVPCLFYGTEHGFNQDNRRNGPPAQGQADFQRETMWDYGWQWGNAYGDKFHASSLYDHIGTLNQLREQYICLRRGSLAQRWQEGGKGLFAFTRTYEDEEALVVINTDWGTKSCTPQVSKPDGTTYVNVLNPTETVIVSGGTLSVSVDSKGSKIFIAGGAPGSKVTTICGRDNLRVVYEPGTGPLENHEGPIYISIGHDGFADSAEYEMTPVGDGWEFNFSTVDAVADINFFFRDDAASPAYDDHEGENWNIPMDGCSDTIELVWAGHTTQWPEDGQLERGDDLGIHVESWPQGGALEGVVVYSIDDGATWNTMPLSYNGIVDNNDKWHASLGTHPFGTTIQYAVMLTDGFTEVWDSNDGSNYFTSVNFGTVAIDWIGNTYHWPLDGEMTSSDDLWVNVETSPLGAGMGGKVVYTTDDGATWQDTLLNLNGVAEDHDWWNVNLGPHPVGTTIRYAVMVTDTTGTDHWDNNSGIDYSAMVTGSGSSLAWFGNTRHNGVRTPEVDMRLQPGALSLELLDLKAGAVYSVQCSSNMTDWVTLSTFTSSNDLDQYLISNAGTGNDPTRYYRVLADAFPIDAPVYEGEEVVIHMETYPQGAATEVNLAYTSDGGTSWTATPMVLAGPHGDNDLWELNLGSYAAGTTIRYAVEVVDDAGGSNWDNNDSDDYEVLLESL